jgi:hypothetical protein
MTLEKAKKQLKIGKDRKTNEKVKPPKHNEAT